jgi:Acyl-CoA carboxylase epsilon subunit
VSAQEITPVISIHPEPTPEELAAIVSAVTSALRQAATAPEPEMRPTSRWARQGRLDAMRALDRADRH